MKKVLLFLIIILAVFSLISCDEVELPDDLEACHHLEFKNVWGGLEVVGIGDCECSAVIIPNVHNGKKVISIGNGAFIDCDNITAIVIPGNVKKVKPEAFVACDRLTTVYIQHGVEKLQSMLFYSGSGTMSQITTEYDIYYEGTMSEFIGLNSWSLLGGSARPWYYSGYETIIFTVYCTDGYLEYNYHDANSTPTKNQYDGDIECPYHVDNDKDRICDNCNEPLPGFAHTHTEGEWIIDKEPSVSTEGRKHTECSSCGKVVREEAIAKLTPSQGLEFTLNDDGESYTLTGIGTCKDKHVAVPETYNGKPVTKVGANVFVTISDDENAIIHDVKSVSLPDTITEIAEYAFVVCLYLEKINIPKNVSHIEGIALGCCNSLVSITVDPENKTYKSIDGNLYTKDGKTLVNYAMGKKDTHFEIPNTVETIGMGAFSFCPFDAEDLFYMEDVVYHANIKNITIPNSVKIIETFAFYFCNSIETINIPDSVTTIGEYAFAGCDSLKTINIPNSITTIEEGTFGGCASLEDVIIGDSVTTIKDDAFAGCPSMKNVTLPKSITTLESRAFNGCSALENIYFKGTVEDWLNMPLQDVNLLHCGANLYLNDKLLTHLVIPDSVTVLGDEFSGCTSIVSVTIPDSVTRIGNKEQVVVDGVLVSPFEEFNRGAFQGCTSLKYVNISDSVTSIGEYTFTECTSLESIVIPDSVEYIGDWAFAECTSLESIVIPDSVEYIGLWAFAYCTSLETISLSNSISIIEDLMFYGCSSLKSINIPNSVTYIGSFAFGNCTSLANITIPESIEHVDSRVFENCNLIKFTEYDNALYLGTSSNPYHILIKAKNTDITSCKIHENTKVIAANAFEGCAYLTSITIPDSVITIGVSAFGQCTKLANVKIGNSLKYIDSTAFASCSSLSSINIPKSLTSIGYRAFANCTSLTSIIIPISVTNMEFSVFSNTSCIVYCEAEAEPDTWDDWWLAWFETPFKGTVIWGYKG